MATLIAEAWETLKEAIVNYTGVSPATFFAAVTLAVVVYYVISSCFASPRGYREREFVAPEPLPPPVQLGEVTEEELKQYDGSDPTKPLLMAIKGQIYDVSRSRMFYGPGGPYALFAGKDASRALAKMSFEEKDLTGDISGLGPFELDALQDWEYKFMSKYTKIGTIKKPDAAVDGESSGNSAEATVAGSDIGPSEPRELGSEHEAVASSWNGSSQPREVGDEHTTVAGSANGSFKTREVSGDHEAAVVGSENDSSEPREVGGEHVTETSLANGSSEPRDIFSGHATVAKSEDGPSETEPVGGEQATVVSSKSDLSEPTDVVGDHVHVDEEPKEPNGLKEHITEETEKSEYKSEA